jgi:hypothetical protein
VAGPTEASAWQCSAVRGPAPVIWTDLTVGGDVGGATCQEETLHQLLSASGGRSVTLWLDGVQDPHNLGACLRTADGAVRLGVQL